MQTRTVRRLSAWVLSSIAVIAVIGWQLTRDALPETVRIATAEELGVYQAFAETFSGLLGKRTSCSVSIESTRGSVENRDLLLSKEVDLALLQHGSVSVDDLAVVAPLFPEVIHVVVRKGREIDSIRDLAGKKTVLGPEGSGMRSSALEVLAHYRVAISDPGGDVYFYALMTDHSLDAAIVTTNIQNQELIEILNTGEFKLLPILDARAIALKHAHFKYFELPRGLYSAGPSVPPESTSTVAVVAFLAVRKDASKLLVTELLGTLYEEDLQSHFPTLIPLRQARDWSPKPLHPSAQAYFDPFDQIGWLASVLESIAAIKELLFALGAGLFLIWQRWSSIKEREQQQRLQELKERLDTFLERTVRIERAQMDTNDPAELKQFLDDVTNIKLEALHELADESLRGDQMFAIFLAQCSNLISKIQSKIIIGRSPT